MATDLTFGIGLTRATSGAELRELCTAAENGSVDVLTAADHLGAPSPFQLLAAASALTTRARLRTYVLDVYFWNPALLAREAATLDVLSGGRAELGLGTGHMRHEHEDAGLPFPPHAKRVAELDRVAAEVRRRLTPDHRPAPLQTPLPVVVGGWGERVLRVAARHAEIVALSGILQVPGRPPGTLRVVSAAETQARIAELGGWVREERDRDTPPVLDALLQKVVVDRPPEQAAVEIAEEFSDETTRMTPEDVLDTPWMLLAATPEDGAAELARRAGRYGVTSWCTHTPSAPALIEVARAYRG